MADEPRTRSASRSRKTTSTADTAHVFWAQTAMSSVQETFVPGVNNIGNRRPRVKGGKTKEVRAYVPVKQPVVETTAGIISDISTVATDIPTRKSKEVSLRDLCVEDKKRVANLIKELAKVVDEKENAEQNLVSERNHYQDQILKLVEQQELVLKEREEVQTKLLEYQSHIVKLQQEQQLHCLHKQRDKHQKLQHRSPAHPDKGKETVSINGAGEDKNGRLRITTAPLLNKDKDMVLTSNPDSYINANAEEKNFSTEEDEEQGTPVELPSQNIYMNEIEESDVEEFSTQALHDLFPLSGNGQPGRKSHRPFTAMIDQQLAKQKAALTSIGYVSSQGHIDEPRKKTTIESENINVVDRFSSSVPKFKSISNQENNEFLEDAREHPFQEKREHQCNRQTEGNVDYMLPSGSVVSPEKAEIFNRFMLSQPQGSQTLKTIDGQKEGIDAAKAERKKDLNNEKTKAHKRKKRPPPSFGVFHPPIMSSTQKSSEIGDYVDSTINSENRLPGMKEFLPRRAEIVSDGESEEVRDSDNEGRLLPKLGRANHANNGDVDIVEGESNQKPEDEVMRRNAKRGKSRVEFSDGTKATKRSTPAMSEERNQLEVDPDYLRYYKNLSANERKKELLKQRSKLLEEQNKLKKILTDQESKLMEKQQARTMIGMEKRYHKDVEGGGDMAAMREMQDTLEEMELRLAQKEAEVKKEKELLLLKRKRQEDRISGLAPVGKAEIQHIQIRNTQMKMHHPAKEDDAMADPESKSTAMSGALKRSPASLLKENRTFSITGKESVIVDPKLTSQREDGGARTIKLKPYTPYIVDEKNKANSPKTKQEAGGKDVESKSKSKSQEAKVKTDDGLVRRLDYSFHSDTEPDTGIAPGTESNIKSNRDAVENMREKSHGVTPGLPMMVDAGTSISFANFTRNEPVSFNGAQSVTREMKSDKKVKKKELLLESPGEKTLAVVEIIDSLDELSDSGTPLKNHNVRQGAKGGNRRKLSPVKKDMAKSINGKGGLRNPHESATLGHRNHLSRFHPSGFIKSHEPLNELRRKTFESQHSRHRNGHSKHIDDLELDLFHLPQFKKDRLDGYRQLIKGDTDESDDTLLYVYDANDDSNIDDIVNALSESMNDDDEENVDGERIQGDGEDESVWDAVVKDLNNISSLKLDSDFEAYGSLVADEDYDRLDLSSQDLKPECVDDSDILEEVFFVNP